MKASLKIPCIVTILFLSYSNSFSTPLSGTYTIGSGGDYPTINSAFSDLSVQGFGGPVIFEVISGIYNEDVNITGIAGNSLTLKSQTGNSSDVILNSITIYFSFNLIIRDLSFNSSAQVLGDNIYFINNDFLNHSFYMSGDSFFNRNFNNVNIIDNRNIQEIGIFGDEFAGSYISFSDIHIKNNIINGRLFFRYSSYVFIENNIIGSGIWTYIARINIVKNKIFGSIDIGYSSEADLYNNFIIGIVNYGSNLINNTIIGGTLTTPALLGCSVLENNIVINPAGGPVISGNYILTSDYNDFYNGGNNNLINNNSASYNNVSDFYNATGFDQHSNSQPVTFISTTDLHLAGSSIGDMQLAGIPDALVPDDIDGQIRSLIHPYKGADEADFPLPVELSSFTSSVNNNGVLLNWTTASETNNSGFEVERTSVNGQWAIVNFIKGNGNSNSPQNYSFTDKNLSSGKYKYRLKQIDFNGNFEYYNLSNEVEIGVPDKFSLSQNYPNPFNPTTKISYELRVTNYVSLKVYDVLGNEIGSLVNQKQNAGRYEVEFNGSNLASGVYFYKLETGSFTAVKKMSLLK